MALLLKDGSVFLHVPKTGGTWVTRVLTELGLVEAGFGAKHASYEGVMNVTRSYPRSTAKHLLTTGPRFAGRVRASFKFCFVRHPVDWYASYWRHNNLKGWPEWAKAKTTGRRPWHPTLEIAHLRAPTFDEYVLLIADQHPGFLERMYGFYLGPTVGFVGHQERLADDLIDVLGRAGIAADEDHIRHREPANDTERERAPLDQAALQRIQAAERAVLDRFDYEPYEAFAT